MSSRYPFLSQNLRTGFLINIPNITSTKTPPNKPIISEYEDQFNKIVSLELLKQQYIGPFFIYLPSPLLDPSSHPLFLSFLKQESLTIFSFYKIIPFRIPPHLYILTHL